MERPTTLLLIAGSSGSGKSTLARALRDSDPQNISVVHFDDFQYDADMLEPDADGYRNWDTPSFTDFDQAYTLLARLIAGSTITVMAKNEYDNPGYIRGDYERKPIEIVPTPLVIAEGHYALLDERVRSLASLTVFLQTDFATSTGRRTKLSDARYDDRYLRPMHDAYVYPTRQFADEAVDVGTKGPSEVLEALQQIIAARGLLA